MNTILKMRRTNFFDCIRPMHFIMLYFNIEKYQKNIF